MKKSSEKKRISDFIPQLGKDLVFVSKEDVLGKVGQEVMQHIVTSILCGGNVRSLTEGLTRRRLTISNASMLCAYLNALKYVNEFKEKPFLIVEEEFTKNSLTKEEKAFLNWMVGLSGKGIQNILRENNQNRKKYLQDLENELEFSAQKVKETLGPLSSTVQLNNEEFFLEWENLLQVFMAIGAQTLTIRGSEKSVYGKLFERLVLGSVLTIFGFDLISKNDISKTNMVFWLTEQGNKREADATLLLKAGKGARFDIGFIGRGNSEISLDKVSRFEREMERGRQTNYMSTIVLVDKIGDRSRIQELASAIQGEIIQMSMSYWVKETAHVLEKKLGLQTEFLAVSDEESLLLIEEKMQSIDLSKFIS